MFISMYVVYVVGVACCTLYTDIHTHHTSNIIIFYCMKPYKESAELCFISIVHIVCHIFPWKI